jgi:hypothetical protein
VIKIVRSYNRRVRPRNGSTVRPRWAMVMLASAGENIVPVIATAGRCPGAACRPGPVTTLADAATAIDAAFAAAEDHEHRRHRRDHAAEDLASRRAALAAPRAAHPP